MSLLLFCRLTIFAWLGLQIFFLNWTSLSLPRLTASQIRNSFSLRLDPIRQTEKSTEKPEQLRALIGQRVGLCNEEQFDAIRSPMTFREMYNLLGPPSNGLDIVRMHWNCVDGRWFALDCIHSYDEMVHDFEARRDPAAPGNTWISMSRDMGRGYCERFRIPDRKSDEVEIAILKFGPKGPPKWY